MQLPETPRTVADLDLMKRLESYGAGTASYLPGSQSVAEATRQACKELHALLASLEKTVGPLLDKVTAKEMDVFTAHDRKHALKVAHIMWHVIAPGRRVSLTPPEIGMLVSAAFIHDLGMFLSDAERERRLSPCSDLWDRLEVSADARKKIAALQEKSALEKIPAKQERLLQQLHQTYEALLCADNRSGHATESRYRGILEELRALHRKDPTNIVDIDAAFSFEGDSYLEKLIEVCISHNQSADALVRRDPRHQDRPGFPRDYPVGSATVDLQFVAAALRIADILDFDRERTPPVLFHYFIPSALDAPDDRSNLEWSKHLAISNWHIEGHEIVFRGRCRSHIVHHGIVHFCELISEEIASTKATFGASDETELFALPPAAKADIHAEGYTYVPYRFELDDERIYRLLMGGAIYGDPLHAVRELVQNAVDACRLRDALTQLNDPAVTPGSQNRIIITYQEPTSEDGYPTLEVLDTGTGMDDWIINRWFLKVGRSFYSSSEFNEFRFQLSKQGFDFAPTSEFGIGFLSTFLLADKVEVETAMWEPLRGDTRKRIMEIHGPTRLIRLSDDENTGAARFRGTRVKLTLTRGHGAHRKLPITWVAIRAYLLRNCVSLPYRIHLRHVGPASTEEVFIDPQPLTVDVSEMYGDYAVKIPVDDAEAGIKGEIALLHPARVEASDRVAANESVVRIRQDEFESPADWDDESSSSLIRGGFRVGSVPGLLRTYRSPAASRAIVSLNWESRPERRYPLTNLARTTLAEGQNLTDEIVRNWLYWLLDHVNELPEGFMDGFDFPRRSSLEGAKWMERFDAYEVYRLAANSWYSALKSSGVKHEDITAWEKSSGGSLSRRTPWQGVFHGVLQDLVLPRVCKLQLALHGEFFLCPPQAGWVEVLKNCKDYISKPVRWGAYVTYVDSIENLLFLNYAGVSLLNERHRNRVQLIFNEADISGLIYALVLLCDSRQQHQVEISTIGLSLLQRAQEHLGDLEIANVYGTWRIGSFKLPKSIVS